MTSRRARYVQSQSSFSMTWRAIRCDVIVFLNGSTLERRLLLFLSDARENTQTSDANLLILFKQDATNLKHMYNDHVNTDMSYDDFCVLCRDCWQRKYGFVVIDKDSSLTNRRYRNGFNVFAIPQND